MTEQPVCQWCQQPVSSTPTWWDDQPQCPDPLACTRRIHPSTDGSSR